MRKVNVINSYRSAISSVHEKVEGYSVDQHPMVTKILKGVFHDRPPLSRYTSTWNVEQVLTYLKEIGTNQDLSLKQLTWKTTMLLALTNSDCNQFSPLNTSYSDGDTSLPATSATSHISNVQIVQTGNPSVTQNNNFQLSSYSTGVYGLATLVPYGYYSYPSPFSPIPTHPPFPVPGMFPPIPLTLTRQH